MKQTDIYTEALVCLRLILQTDHPEFKNWLDWLGRDIEDWTQRREGAPHLLAYGGMGSFNDLPKMRGNQIGVLHLWQPQWQAARNFNRGIDCRVCPRGRAGILSSP